MTTYAVIGFSILAMAITLDFILDLGGSAFIADICRTILDGGDEPMASMPGMERQPIPLIVLSLAITTGAAVFLTRESHRAGSGRAAPDKGEQAAILYGIIAAAAASKQSSRVAVSDIYRIVTGHGLDPALADYAADRIGASSGSDPSGFRFAPIASELPRRRVLAAALITGCVDKPATEETEELIERMAIEIGATGQDLAVADTALREWADDCNAVQGVSRIAVLRDRPLTLVAA